MIFRRVSDFNLIKEDLERFRSIIISDVPDISRGVANRIFQTSDQLCIVGTPESTGIPGYVGGTLKSTGRLVELSKKLYMIIYGDPSVINPNTGLPCNYALLVHDGTSSMPPRPWVEWSIRRHLGEWSLRVDEAVRRGMGSEPVPSQQ